MTADPTNEDAIRRLAESLLGRRVRIVIEATLLAVDDGDLMMPDSIIAPNEVVSVEAVTDA